MSIIPLVNIDETELTFYGGGLALISIKASIGSFARQINRFYPIEPPSDKPIPESHPAAYQKRELEAKSINEVIEEAEANAISEMEKIYLPYKNKVNEAKRQQKIEEQRRKQDLSKTLPLNPVASIKPVLPYRNRAK